MALLILALLQRIFLMSSLMLLLVWLIFFMVLIKLLPILGTISRSEERFSRNAETDLVCRLLLEKKKKKKYMVRDGNGDITFEVLLYRHGRHHPSQFADHSLSQVACAR